ISIAVALALWPFYQREGEKPIAARRLPMACLLLGFLAGFRPEMVVSMAPLPLLAAVRNRLSFREYLVSALALVAGMAPWLIALLVRVGGFSGFLAMMQIYSAEQAGKSSLLFGATWSGALKMFADAFWWASLGVATWTPAILLVAWRKINPERNGQGYFLS